MVLTWVERGIENNKTRCEPTSSVGFCASLDEPYGVFDELPAGLNKLHHLIHGFNAADANKSR